MGRWNSRRAGPEHPMLFVDARDIPVVVEAPRPRAAEAVAPFAELLRTVEAEPLASLTSRHVGRSVVVAGERRRPEPALGGDALLDDGTGLLPLTLPPGAPPALRDVISARFLLVHGRLRVHEGQVALEVAEAADLRAVARQAECARR